MKTLKQRFIKAENRKASYKEFPHISDIFMKEVKEWLQQKRHKKISFVEDVENKFIDELLEELEQ